MVTGVVSTVVADTEFSIKVGAGGAGGICNKTQVNGGFGASYAGSDSTVSLGGVAVLTAFGGGNDKGTTSSSAKSGRVGGTGYLLINDGEDFLLVKDIIQHTQVQLTLRIWKEIGKPAVRLYPSGFVNVL